MIKAVLIISIILLLIVFRQYCKINCVFTHLSNFLKKNENLTDDSFTDFLKLMSKRITGTETRLDMLITSLKSCSSDLSDYHKKTLAELDTLTKKIGEIKSLVNTINTDIIKNNNSVTVTDNDETTITASNEMKEVELDYMKKDEKKSKKKK